MISQEVIDEFKSHPYEAAKKYEELRPIARTLVFAFNEIEKQYGKLGLKVERVDVIIAKDNKL